MSQNTRYAPPGPFSDANLRLPVATVLRSRDLALLTLLARFRALGLGQLEELLLGEAALPARSLDRVTFRALSRLRQRGLVTSSADAEWSVGGRPRHRVYVLTPRGRRTYALLDPRFPTTHVGIPSLASYPHQGMLADIAVAIGRSLRRVDRDPRISWLSDWETVELLGSTRVIPDALLRWDTATSRCYAFIEADMGTERGRAFERKITKYLDAYDRDTWREALPVWPVVLTVTTTPSHVRRLHRTVDDLLARLGRSDIVAAAFRFTSIDALQGPSGFVAPIWHTSGRVGPGLAVDARRPQAS